MATRQGRQYGKGAELQAEETTSLESQASTRTLSSVFAHSHSPLLLVLLVMVLVAGGLLVPSVFQVGNIANVSRSTAVIGLVAVGMTFVLLTGEIDLSVGSILSLSLVTGGQFLDQGDVAALVITAFCGAALGCINGLAIGYGRVNSLIMTLGTLTLYGGLANLVTRGQATYLYEAPLYMLIGKARFLGVVPVPMLIFLVTCAVFTVVLTLTKAGRDTYYTGSNPVTAWYSGVNVAKIKLLAFTISGFLAALAGPMLASLANRITPTQGEGLELTAIAIAVLGGVALEGGRGTVVGTLLGALIFGFVLNILALSGLSTFTNQIFRGGLLILVVLLFQRVQGSGGVRRRTWRQA